MQSGSTGGPAPIEKSGQLKLTATVPNNLPGAPVSPQDPQADKVTGIYARNNAYPLADVRILAFGDGDTPILDLIQPFGVIAADVYCDMPLTDTTVAGGVGDVSEHKNWQPEDGVFEFTVKTAPMPPRRFQPAHSSRSVSAGNSIRVTRAPSTRAGHPHARHPTSEHQCRGNRIEHPE